MITVVVASLDSSVCEVIGSVAEIAGSVAKGSVVGCSLDSSGAVVVTASLVVVVCSLIMLSAADGGVVLTSSSRRMEKSAQEHKRQTHKSRQNIFFNGFTPLSKDKYRPQPHKEAVGRIFKLNYLMDVGVI